MTSAEEDNHSPSFEPVGRRRVFESVLDQLEAMIEAGTLKVGDRLPSERTLSEALQVGRPSLREALRVLEAMNVLTAKTGVGAGAGTRVSSEAGQMIARLMRLYMALGHFEGNDLFELRDVLEVHTAISLADKISSEGLDALKRHIRGSEASDAEETYQEFIARDAAFQITLATNGNNRLLAHFMGAIRQPMLQILSGLDFPDGNWQQYADRINSDRCALVEALGSRDARKAREAALSAVEAYAALRNAAAPGESLESDSLRRLG